MGAGLSRNMRRRPFNILVAINLSVSVGQRILAGLLNDRQHSRTVNIRILHDLHDLMSVPLHDGSVDGIIASVFTEQAKRFVDSKVPLVVLDLPPTPLYRRKENISIIMEDNEQIGRIGAKHLMSLGQAAAIGFVPDEQNRGWSRLREHAFVSYVKNAGKEVWVYRSTERSLDDWLKAMPKPAAIMTAFDFRSKDVLDACTRCSFKIPEQVSILGVDNNCLICEHSSPALSSIDYDQEGFGVLAIKTICRMIRSSKPWGRRKLIVDTNAHVVDRASTKPIATSAHLAIRALHFIDRHYHEGISAADVTKALGVSRRLVELRLSEAGAPTLRMAIENRRIKELERLLNTTKIPISKVTALAGFTNIQRAKYIFKSRNRVSMKAFRAAAQARTSV